MGRGPALRSLYGGPDDLGSRIGAPDFWKLPKCFSKLLGGLGLMIPVRTNMAVSINSGVSISCVSFS